MSAGIGYWDAYMPVFRVQTVATTGESIPPKSSIQDVYVDYIDEYWQVPGRGETLVVLLKERSAQNWWTLGQTLTTDLLAMGTHAGLSFDGQIPLAIELALLPKYLRTEEPSLVNLTIRNREHSTKSDWTDKSVTWNSLQSVRKGSWLPEVWSAVQSDWFDYGCNLLVTVYDVDVISQVQWDDALSLKTFGETLKQAIGWIAPMDGNMGFFVGIPNQSMLHKKLLTQLAEPPSDNQP